MALQPGQQLAQYRLIEKIGEGGMGVVWRATDTDLDRDVAIKLLPEGFAGDTERLQRFEREAKLLASLNHPHIATIHGFHRSESLHFLAMELVEGEDLAQRIQRGPITLERVVEIAAQVAEALEIAHARGVIHRDLKPANIKLTAEGQVKVLDFGLAKALSVDPASGGASADPALSPTLTSAGTLAGVIIGTAAYMSPEQARGRSVDRRADLWAFGAILYEMLTGRALYGGETVSDTLASVLKEQPDWSALPGDLPPPVRRLLRRCLTKDPRQRLSDAGDARIELREAFDPPHPGEQVGPVASVAPEATRRPSWLPWAVAVFALAVMFAVLLAGRDTADVRPLNLSVALPDGVKLEDGQEQILDLSPDGRFLVFHGLSETQEELYLRRLDSAEVTMLPGTKNSSNPFFSPDGEWVGFFNDGKLMKVPTSGGSPITICDNQGSPRGASWGDDGTIVFPRHFDGGLLQVAASGGTPVVLTETDPERNERTHRWPHVVSEHDVVLYTVATTDSPEFYDDARIDALVRSTGERKTVFEGASFARYVKTGHLVFAREGFLFAVPFDIDRLETTGSPQPIVEGVMGARNSGVAYASIARTGLLAYVAGKPVTRRRVLNWRYFDGRTEPVVGVPIAGHITPSIAPDGDRIATAVSNEGAFDLWTYSQERQTATRLTFEGIATLPLWTPDGRTLVYHSVIDGMGAVYFKPADGSGEPTKLYETTAGTAQPDDISTDGRLVTMSIYGTKQADVYVKSLVDLGAEPEPFAAGPADELHGTFSPDGRWIAYTSDETGDYELIVRPYPGPGGRWQISTGGGVHPRWSPDGRKLYYWIGRRLLVTDIDATDGVFRFSTPRVLFDDLPRAQLTTSWDISPDGQAALFAEADNNDRGAPEQVTVVVNWLDELARLVPAD